METYSDSSTPHLAVLTMQNLPAHNSIYNPTSNYTASLQALGILAFVLAILASRELVGHRYRKHQTHRMAVSLQHRATLERLFQHRLPSHSSD